MTAKKIIDSRQQRELADLLEDCPSMMRPRDRKLIVGQLDPDIQRQINTEGKPTNVIKEMVAASANHTDGIENLIRKVSDAERNSIPMRSIWKRLPDVLGFPDPELHETISDVLEHLTAEHVSRESMKLSFIQAVPAELRTELGLPDPSLMCRWWLLKEAQSFSQRLDGPFPFADFIGRLLQKISDKQLNDALIRWGAHITGETEGSFKQSVRRGTESTESEGPTRPHLIVQLAPNPSPANEKNYRVSFHLHSGKNDGRSLADPDKELEDLLLEDIEAELDEFLRRLSDDALPQAIEIMVPGDYLTAVKPPPHLWKLRAGRRKGRERLLGKKYPVYLRLNRHERLAEDKAELDAIPADQRLSWKTKWLEFKDSKSPGDCIQWESDPSACSWESLDETICHSKGRPCLVLAFEPEIPPDDAWLDDVLLESGVPVALWGDVGEADIKSILKPLIDGGSLRRLPAHLWEQRDAMGRKEGPYRLTLLWDNPERDIHKRRQETDEPRHYDMNVLS